MPRRLSPRIVPPCPITTAVETGDGRAVAYGVIFDISSTGACVWTDACLTVGATLRFRISFAYPPELHELLGRVLWTQEALNGARKNTARCGIEWLSVSDSSSGRLCQLMNRAVPPHPGGEYPFEKAWIVRDGWPPPPLTDPLAE